LFEDDLIRKYALKNAFDYNGKASASAVISKVLQEHPELKPIIKELMNTAKTIIDEVNRLSKDKQIQELQKSAPELMIKQKKEENKELPELPNVKGKVIMRMAPNPNAPPHLGNARMIILNDYYIKRYKGKLILKFDDTDPKNEAKRPRKEMYKMLENDLNWLGVEYHYKFCASERLERYYEIFEKLLSLEKAYICTCDSEEWKKMKAEGIPCKCRDLKKTEQEKRWKNMLSGKYKQGTAVARIKTDIKYKDPAERDFAAFRVIEKPEHPLVGNKFLVWPMMDMGNAVDDHDNEVTHILRGMELVISEKRQKWIYKYLGWTYPNSMTFGKLSIEGSGTMSKSKMVKGVLSGEFTGWDDVRFASLLSLRRRGFLPEAVREFILSCRMTGNDSKVSFSKLESINRKILDEKADRYYFVEEPRELIVEKIEKEIEKKIFRHPTFHDRGVRIFNISKGTEKFYISNSDFSSLERGELITLKDLFNIDISEINEKAYSEYSKNQKITKETKKIQFVKKEDYVNADILMPDNSTKKGFCEPEILNLEIGKVIQFERFGFCRLEKKSKKSCSLVYVHS